MRRTALLFVLSALSPLIVAADEIQPSFAMFSDPPIAVPPPKWILDPEQLTLWKQVLVRPEVEYQRLAADAIGHAHRSGFPGMEAFKPELLRIMQASGADPAAVRAAAMALIALDSRDHAAELFEASRRNGRDVREVIEPALAAWKYPPIIPIWRERLTATTTPRRELLLAARGLSTAGDADSVPALVKIVHESQRPSDVRLGCARAAGTIVETGLEPDVSRLMQGASLPLVHRLCAVTLLMRHSSETARQQLAQAAQDSEPAVAAEALGRLFAIDPALVLPLVELSLKNRAAEVRDWAARALIALPTPERIVSLANLLDDPHPTIRGRVREALFVHAQQPSFDPVVRQSVMEVLDRESWRGQEQAALLLAALDHKPAALRLVALLESPRPEVMIATAWGLRKLAIPETIPALFDKAQRQSAERLQGGLHPRAIDHQVAHLFEALALMNHAPALPLLKQYLPKNPILGEFSRGAAVWSMGILLKGTPDDELAAQLMGRVRDLAGMPPETALVRRMSAISIGRMQAKSQLAAVREFLGEAVDVDEAEYAQRWTVKELSGEELPFPEPLVFVQGGWFIVPLPRTQPQ